METIESSNLCTFCVKEPHGMHAKAHLDCKSLLIGNKEKTSGNIVLQSQMENVTAMASIFAYLEDIGINFNSQQKAFDSGLEGQSSEMNITKTLEQQKVLLMDENFTYKMIEELEEWKEKQQQIFLVDLKSRELKFFDKLKKDWNVKQTTIEQEYLQKAERLSNLTQTLEEAHKSLKDQSTRRVRDDQEIQKVKQDLEKRFGSQMLLIRERARQLEGDMVHELKQKDIKLEDAERCIQHLKAEKCEFRQKAEQLQQELDLVKAHMVPKEEVEGALMDMRLLKEKCEVVQQSKNFYKEQWAKACRECHKVRRDKIASVNEDIFYAKNDLLSGFLDDDRCSLKIDKQELEQIKHCLNLSDDEI